MSRDQDSQGRLACGLDIGISGFGLGAEGAELPWLILVSGFARASALARRMKLVLLGSGGWIPTATRETCCPLRSQGHRRPLPRRRVGTAPRPGARGAPRRRALRTDRPDALPPGSHRRAELHPGAPTRRATCRLGSGQRALRAADGGHPRSAPRTPTRRRARLGRASSRARGGRESVRRVRRHDPSSAEAQRTDLRPAGRRRRRVLHGSAFDEENADFAHGCSILLHEAWSPEPGPNADIHTSARECGTIARRAGVDRFVLIHLNPLPTPRLDRGGRARRVSQRRRRSGSSCARSDAALATSSSD